MAIDRESLGKAIRRVRELRGLSQASLAKQAGLQGNSVALIERGQRGISLESLNALGDALNVPAACLAILGSAKVTGDPSGAALIKSLQKLIVATVVAEAKIDAKTQRRSARKRKSPVRKYRKRLQPA